jgi:hypothetical protein
MPTANLFYLVRLTGPLNTIGDSVVDELESSDDESAMKELIIRELVLPEFYKMSARAQEGCKYALQYYLSTGNADFYDVIDRQQECPIDPPSNAKNFFIWIWDELFPGESYEIADLSNWAEVIDEKEPWR